MSVSIPMKNKNQFRQGDVFIERVKELPTDAKAVKGRAILAHGEATGHAHEIDMDAAEAWKHGDTVVGLRVKRSAPVKHQEHAPIPLKRGTYKITRQREYSPSEIRNVAD